jgi:hypothetical protein
MASYGQVVWDTFSLRRSAFAAALIVPMAASEAAAQDRCPTFVGQTVEPETFYQVAASLGNVASKGEFETTAQYRARMTAVGTGQRIIAKDRIDLDHMRYDADSGAFRVERYAFNNEYLDFPRALHDSRSVVPIEGSGSIGVVVSRVEVSTGQYEAQNGFGARATIQQVSRVTHAIYDRPARATSRGVERLFVSESDDRGYIGRLPVPAAQAQALRPQFKIAFVAQPKPPFLTRGQYLLAEPTVSNPVEIMESAEILIADLQCGLLMDATYRVLASYPMN